MNTKLVKSGKKAGKQLAGIAALCGSALLLVACATVQPAAVTIADALAAPDGTNVVVNGTVVQQMPEDEEILLQDATGQIIAEVDDDLIGELQFGADTQLRVLGEIDRDADRSVIVARKIQVVQVP